MKVFTKSILKSSFIFFFTLCLVFSLTAQNNEKPIDADSPVYGWLSRLYTMQGKSLPTRFAPATAEHIKFFLHQLNRSSLDMAGEKIYQAIEKEIEVKPIYHEGDNFSVKVSQELNPELYGALGNELPWEYGYIERPPLYKLLMEGWFFKWSYMAMDIELKKDPIVVLDQAQPISNVITSMGQVDFQWPYYAGVELGGEHWDAHFMRTKLSTTSGFTNMVLTPDLGSVDNLGFSTWWSGFTYNFLVIPFDNYDDITDTSKTYYGYYRTDTSLDSQGSDYLPSFSKVFVMHRLDFRLFETFTIAVSEILLAKNPSLQSFNPWIPGHNWYLQSNANSDLAFDLEWATMKGWTMWGQFYMDYMRTPFKDSEYTDKNPRALGYLLGNRWTWSQDDINWSLETEGVYTDPFLYINQNIDAVYTQRFESNYDGSDGHGIYIIDRPFGFKYGPDTIAAYLRLKAEKPRWWTLQVDAPFVAKGENTIKTVHPASSSSLNNWTGTDYFSLISPTGCVQLSQTIGLAAELGPDMLKWEWNASLGIRLDLIGIWNYEHEKGANRFAAQTALTWKNTW